MSKKPKKPSQHLAEIVATLEQMPEGLSTGQIAASLGLSTSHAREILTNEVKRGNIKRAEVDEDGTTVFKFFNVAHKNGDLDDLMATGDEIADSEQIAHAPDTSTPKEAKRKGKPRGATSGRGNPEAKKAINPQQTLEDKKAITKELGGTMTWAGRQWHMKGPDFDVSMTSREIATFTLDQFRKKLGG
jgi:hypothetical protein